MDTELQIAMEYNDLPFDVEDINDILAIWEGERDEENWRWIVRLNNKNYAFIDGWCDYIGWDCRSYLYASLHTSLYEAAIQEQHPAVRQDLIRQLLDGRRPTWDEAMTMEGFGYEF